LIRRQANQIASAQDIAQSVVVIAMIGKKATTVATPNHHGFLHRQRGSRSDRSAAEGLMRCASSINCSPWLGLLSCFIAVPLLDLFLGLYGLQLNAPLLLSAALAAMTIVVVASLLVGKDKAG
jgi:hypothetical protein